jgi:CheY-like chemotaxis protein
MSEIPSKHGLRADFVGKSKDPDPKNASVLVVDPSPLSLLALAGVLHAQGFQCVCARDKTTALRAIELGPQDIVVWDVGDDALAALEALSELRTQPEHQQIPAVMLAESRWAGLEKKTESLSQSTCVLFKPVDPQALGAVTQRMLWMPQLEASHRRRGTRPNRPGWVTL